MEDPVRTPVWLSASRIETVWASPIPRRRENCGNQTHPYPRCLTSSLLRKQAWKGYPRRHADALPCGTPAAVFSPVPVTNTNTRSPMVGFWVPVLVLSSVISSRTSCPSSTAARSFLDTAACTVSSSCAPTEIVISARG